MMGLGQSKAPDHAISRGCSDALYERQLGRRWVGPAPVRLTTDVPSRPPSMRPCSLASSVGNALVAAAARLARLYEL
jgi:hypothetical protein